MKIFKILKIYIKDIINGYVYVKKITIFWIIYDI